MFAGRKLLDVLSVLETVHLSESYLTEQEETGRVRGGCAAVVRTLADLSGRGVNKCTCECARSGTRAQCQLTSLYLPSVEHVSSNSTGIFHVWLNQCT